MKQYQKLLHISLAIICGLVMLTGMSWAEDKPLMMATTTSTDNTGLLDYLAPHFTKATGIELKWTATGTGQALELGKNCDVDILMVHAPSAEKEYVAAGYGINRKEFMYNDFVIIGPKSDPAGIKGKSVSDALAAIVAKKSVFTSRGDSSGTHKKELSLWAAANQPQPEKQSWYVQSGQGMLATINIAAERQGYTLTDRGTYIKYESDKGGKPPLVILVEGDQTLLNQYSVIEVNRNKCPNVQTGQARQFTFWITGPQGQMLIKEFKLLGKQLFTPNAVK